MHADLVFLTILNLKNPKIKQITIGTCSKCVLTNVKSGETIEKGFLCRSDTSVEAENLVIVPFKSVTLHILLVLEF